jgi:hypothetical protein
MSLHSDEVMRPAARLDEAATTLDAHRERVA